MDNVRRNGSHDCCQLRKVPYLMCLEACVSVGGSDRCARRQGGCGAIAVQQQQCASKPAAAVAAAPPAAARRSKRNSTGQQELSVWCRLGDQQLLQGRWSHVTSAAAGGGMFAAAGYMRSTVVEAHSGIQHGNVSSPRKLQPYISAKQQQLAGLAMGVATPSMLPLGFGLVGSRPHVVSDVLLCRLLVLCCDCCHDAPLSLDTKQRRRPASPASWRPPLALLLTTGAGTAAWSPCRCVTVCVLCCVGSSTPTERVCCVCAKHQAVFAWVCVVDGLVGAAACSGRVSVERCGWGGDRGVGEGSQE